MKFQEFNIEEVKQRIDEITEYVFPLRTDLPEGEPITRGFTCPVNEEHDLDWHERINLLKCDHCDETYHVAQCCVPERAYATYILSTHDLLFIKLHNLRRFLDEKDKLYNEQYNQAYHQGNSKMCDIITGRRQIIELILKEFFK